VLLKTYRAVDEGIHPEVEIGRALMEKTAFSHAAPLAGGIEYRTGRGRATTIAVLLGYVANEGDAWSYTVDALKRFFVDVLAHRSAWAEPDGPSQPLLDLVAEPLPPQVVERIGSFLESVRLMGQRTAELHVALSSLTQDPEFAPEPFTVLYQRSLYQTGRTQISQVLDLLRDRQPRLPEESRTLAETLLARRGDMLAQLHTILERKVNAQRTRCHGDFRLGSLLSTGKDFVIIDLEGEMLRPLTNRRHKRTPIEDVANMLHSIYSAAHKTLRSPDHRPEDVPALEPWVRFWDLWVSVAFVKSYLDAAQNSTFLPQSRDEVQVLFDFYLLSRGLHALRWQLLTDPAEAHTPLQALLRLLEFRGKRAQEQRR